MRIEHFAGAVGAELPSFVGPQDGNHRQAEIGEERNPVLCCAHRQGDFASMMTPSEKHHTQDNDDCNLYEGGPILEVGALARAPDIHDGDDGDHHHSNDC